MADSTPDDGSLGCLSVGAGFVMLSVLISFLQWLWGIVVAVAIWLWLAPGRLLAWILSWPLFSGYLVLGLLAAAATGMLLWLLLELVLRLLWPSQFLRTSVQASQKLRGILIRRGEEVMQLDCVVVCDHVTSSASVKLLRCFPRQLGHPDKGICIDVVEVEGIPVHPDQAHLSHRFRTLRQPTRTYLESLQRHGLDPIASNSIEVKAWQALMDSEQELAKLKKLRETARAMLQDTRRMQEFSVDNELLSPTRQRSLALMPKLNADIARIDERHLELCRFGYKLYEFLNIPQSLRSFEMADDMEATLLAQRGLSDELFEEIKLIEQAYGELIFQ